MGLCRLKIFSRTVSLGITTSRTSQLPSKVQLATIIGLYWGYNGIMEKKMETTITITITITINITITTTIIITISANSLTLRTSILGQAPGSWV